MKIVIGINIVIVAFVIFLGYSYFNSTKKIVFINTGDVFNAFKMSKEIDTEIKQVEEKKQGIIDSLASNLSKIQNGIIKMEAKDFDFLKREFIVKRNQFSEDMAKLKQISMEKIWKQINQYISDYGKENKVDIILGANGQGSLMYANDKIDITKDVIEFVNNKYVGIK